MLRCKIIPYTLRFKAPVKTSKGAFAKKPTWYVVVYDESRKDLAGVGECGFLPRVSPEDLSDIAEYLRNLDGKDPEECLNSLEINSYPSVKFGIETALKDFREGGSRVLYPSPFTEGAQGVKIHGLIWIDTTQKMKLAARDLIERGFRVLKLKVDGRRLNRTIRFLEWLRRSFEGIDLRLRLDANGSFNPDTALKDFHTLSEYGIDLIEQPFMPGLWKATRKLSESSPIAVALDEEIIGVRSRKDKESLLKATLPHYIVIKPSLIGGLNEADEWADIAEKMGINWFVTSLLESNVGLNAIAQWAYIRAQNTVHGLGTGLLYTNNIRSPLYLKSDRLYHSGKNGDWDSDFFLL